MLGSGWVPQVLYNNICIIKRRCFLELSVFVGEG